MTSVAVWDRVGYEKQTGKSVFDRTHPVFLRHAAMNRSLLTGVPIALLRWLTVDAAVQTYHRQVLVPVRRRWVEHNKETRMASTWPHLSMTMERTACRHLQRLLDDVRLEVIADNWSDGALGFVDGPTFMPLHLSLADMKANDTIWHGRLVSDGERARQMECILAEVRDLSRQLELGLDLHGRALYTPYDHPLTLKRVHELLRYAMSGLSPIVHLDDQVLAARFQMSRPLGDREPSPPDEPTWFDRRFFGLCEAWVTCGERTPELLYTGALKIHSGLGQYPPELEFMDPARPDIPKRTLGDYSSTSFFLS